MKEWTDFIKSIIRPFLIVWGVTFYSICSLNQIEVPAPVAYLIGAIIIEYFGERAIKRIRE